MAVLTPTAKMQFLDATGAPLVGGLLYTYAAGTTTPQASYTDATGATANTNPVVLNARGEANVWLGSATYKFKLCDSTNTELWTVDNISAPTSALSPVLSGNVTIDSDSAGPALKITQTGTGPVLRVQDSIDPDSTPFLIDATGQVGIGTASPGSALDVADGTIQVSSSGVSRSKIYADATNSYYTAEGARAAVITANGSNLIYAASNGYVGIKNSSPTVELDVTGAAKTSTAITAGTSISAGSSIVAGTTIASGTTLTAGSSLTVTTSASVGTTLSVDTVQEKTAAAGVSIPSTLKVDTISGKTVSTTLSIAGVSIASSQVDPSNRVITTRTAVATTSGSIAEFTTIPSWVKRITFMFKGVSLSASDNLLVQLGTAASYTATYVSSSVLYTISAPANGYSYLPTTGYGIYVNSASDLLDGIMTITLIDTNTWVSTHTIYSVSGVRVGTGTVALGAALTRIKVIPSGVNTFDAGSVNILYE